MILRALVPPLLALFVGSCACTTVLYDARTRSLPGGASWAVVIVDRAVWRPLAAPIKIPDSAALTDEASRTLFRVADTATIESAFPTSISLRRAYEELLRASIVVHRSFSKKEVLELGGAEETLLEKQSVFECIGRWTQGNYYPRRPSLTYIEYQEFRRQLAIAQDNAHQACSHGKSKRCIKARAKLNEVTSALESQGHRIEVEYALKIREWVLESDVETQKFRALERYESYQFYESPSVHQGPLSRWLAGGRDSQTTKSLNRIASKLPLYSKAQMIERPWLDYSFLTSGNVRFQQMYQAPMLSAKLFVPRWIIYKVDSEVSGARSFIIYGLAGDLIGLKKTR